MSTFDLLTTVEYGGCSAKLSPTQLAEALKEIPQVKHPDLLVDIETHDDAGVYKISDDRALVQTTDFFSPICSDPFEFGQIAAANALSDVYAMGGKPLTAMNLVMFPSQKIPLEVLAEILKGGQDKVTESGAILVGGHTIDDYPPKYGLAVTGMVHPDKVITNAGAAPGDVLILTKPIGMGALVAGQRIGEANLADYRVALDTMKLLNKAGGEIMASRGIKCATDVTGFSLLGHAYKMAIASNATFSISGDRVPFLAGAWELFELGCIPGAAFRNLTYIEEGVSFSDSLDYNRKMLMLDAQTSGGLLMCAPGEIGGELVTQLRESGYPATAIIGSVGAKQDKALLVS